MKKIVINSLLLFLIIIILLSFNSCVDNSRLKSKDYFTGSWTLEILQLKNENLTSLIKNTNTYFDENSICFMPINRFKKTFWEINYKDKVPDSLSIISSEYYLPDHDTNNYFLGKFKMQFYESDKFLFLELSNDSVMVLLKRNETIIYQERPIYPNSKSYSKFIPFGKFYHEYYLTYDFFFNWYHEEKYPRFDSKFFKIKENYSELKPILISYLKDETLTRMKSCNNNKNLLLKDVAKIVMFLMENYNIMQLKNIDRDSCLLNDEIYWKNN